MRDESSPEQSPEMAGTSGHPASTACVATADQLSRAQGASPDTRAPHVSLVQDPLLAAVEARLADEVRRLVSALEQFGRSAQAIREDVPPGAEFSQLITGFLSLCSLQLANALSLSLQRRTLTDDGAEYLRELGLCLEEFFRELDLDGHRFLAVALVDQQRGQLARTAEA